MESAKSSVSECDKHSIQSLQTEQLTELRCPVCKKYMKPPIYLCENNHGVCENCHELMSECSKCQSSLTERRSTHLEALSGLILFPCDLCHEEFYLDDLSDHKCGQIDDEPTVMCMIGQVHGDCIWKGTEKDVLNHYSSNHPNNYWTKEENIAQWDYINSSSSVGIQNIFVIDLDDCTVIVVQKYDSDTQSLQWNANCKCDKGLSDQYIYEIQIIGDLETLRFRNVIKDDNNIMMSLPISNEIIIPVQLLHECNLKDNHIITYKLIIHEKGQLEPPPVIYFERRSEHNITITRVDDSSDSNKQLQQSCGQKTWNAVVDSYMYVKKKLTCS